MSLEPTRRAIVIGAAATLTAGNAAANPGVSAAPTPKTATAVGIVRRAPGAENGAPMAGVLVSNGREIARTDADGRYSLPVDPGQSIFVIKPAGFQVAVDPATKLPNISRVYDPEGTPVDLGFRYAGLPPTGPLPTSIDFELVPSEEPHDFDVILFTDPQPESTSEIEFIRDDVVSDLIGTSAVFGITCGDIAFDDLSMYGRINRLIGTIGIPWWNVGGNHDLDYEAPDARRSRDTYKRVFGAPYYAHAYGNALFVMLDNVEYLGAGSGKPDAHGKYRGMISKDQLTFVEGLLKATPSDRLVVFVMHIPLETYIDPRDPAQNTANARDLLALIGDRPSVSFAGHTHSTEHHYFGAEDGVVGPSPHHHQVLTAVSGSWWSGPLDHRGIACADSYDGTPNGHHVLSVAGSAYSTRFVPAAEPADQQMRLSLETQFHQDDDRVEREQPMTTLLRSPIDVDQVHATRLVVNVFDGGPRTKVVWSIDGGLAMPMTRTSRVDPFIVQVYGRHPETIKSWVHPQKSSHIWQSRLPTVLAPGAYALSVVATDEYGRDHSARMVLEVE